METKTGSSKRFEALKNVEGTLYYYLPYYYYLNIRHELSGFPANMQRCASSQAQRVRLTNAGWFEYWVYRHITPHYLPWSLFVHMSSLPFNTFLTSHTYMCVCVTYKVDLFHYSDRNLTNTYRKWYHWCSTCYKKISMTYKVLPPTAHEPNMTQKLSCLGEFHQFYKMWTNVE